MPLPKYIDAVEQAAKKVQQARDKAVKQEYKTEQTLSNAQHKHDRAVVNKKKVEHDLSVFPHQMTTDGVVVSHHWCLFPRCNRGIFKRSVKPLRVGVQRLSELSARKTLEM